MRLIIIVLALLANANMSTAQATKDQRESFSASFYGGIGIDSFAAGELKKVINPDATNDIQERGAAGFDFQYRLYRNAKNAGHQLWVYGQTVHGVRSTDFDCSKTPDLPVCKSFFDPLRASDRTIYILRNASTLEAAMGLRYEFLRLNVGDENQASLYAKTEYGFLTVSKSGSDVVDNHQWIALGALATAGRFESSFLQVGFGRTDLFAQKSKDRWKINGYLEWPISTSSKFEWVRGFAEMVADTDFGHGSDSIQTYLGITLDLNRLLK